MSDPVRILVAEDHPEDAELIVRKLRRSRIDLEWRRVETTAEYQEQLDWRPDVILADYNMPRLDPRWALQVLRELDLDIPFIVVSGSIGEEMAVEMMRQGATDYVLKDRLARLPAALARALEETRLRKESRRAAQELRAAEARFHLFMSHNPALAFIKDSQGRVLYRNGTEAQIRGLALDESSGPAARIRSHDQAVLSTGRSSQLVEEVTTPDGRTRQMLTYRFPFTDADGNVLLGGVAIDISEQVRTQRALATSLAAREALLQEVHHRVKNNLQIVASLLTLQADSLKDSEAAKAMREIQARVHAMSAIHEQLRYDIEPDRLDFSESIRTLSGDLLYSWGGSAHRVRLAYELDRVSLHLNQAIPCGLILNELLTNSLKHAFPDGRKGTITIRLHECPDQQVQLTVADDGVGFEHGSRGHGTSLGMRILGILTRQLDGSLERGDGPGTAYTLTFRRSEPADPGPAHRPSGALSAGA